MPGRSYDKLALIAAEQEGLLAAADAREAGIDPHRLVDMERRGEIERVARGLCRFPLLNSRPQLGQLTQATMWLHGGPGRDRLRGGRGKNKLRR